MRTNSKGILRIDWDENNSCQIVFEPRDSTVWLHRSELPALFGISIQAVSACIDVILKDNIVDVNTACKYDLCVTGKRIRHNVQEVRLDMIIAMAFHLGSANAKILREWFVRRCLYGIDDIPLLKIQNFQMN
ncbi:MAG: hypothetical protein E6767_19425 [Dysgonomonas sp.]|nr:hypothetical protein [Dysgonomonas sp.]